jgi:rhamnulokinase
MGASADYLAIDLGASSGRGVVGSFDGGSLTLREVHRFPNVPLSLPTGLHWDAPRLFHETKRAMMLAAQEGAGGGRNGTGVELAGIGIDTWGVDYALLSSAGELLGLPHHYRDGRTRGLVEEACRVAGREHIYARTGIQFMALNTLYQLLADLKSNDGRLEAARTLLFMPDLLNYWLTGERSSERSIASTSQLYDTGADAWATDIVRQLRLPERVLPEVVRPGTQVGALLPRIAEETGVRRAVVIAPASHDTASAVAAVPARGGEDWAYVSSGTWSLVGRELKVPVRSAAALAANFTNECGVGGMIRFHKNVAGLWLLQECLRNWAAAGRAHSFEEIAAMAASGAPFAALVDPDGDAFAEPCDMPSRIREAAVRTGQRPPSSDAEIVRCILESLALKCRTVIDTLESLTGAVRTIHVVGGGARNAVLCQFTANACGRPVIAGPVEATAAGNVMVQAMAQGRVASLGEIRAVIARSVEQTVYEPRQRSEWEAAAERFARLALR